MKNLGLQRRWANRPGAVGRVAIALAKRGQPEPFTPRMIEGLKALRAGETLAFESTCVGRPTKQRLAKFGLAEFMTPKDWDGPMRITRKGLLTINAAAPLPAPRGEGEGGE